uniref:Uncharacterized protein n=1 Tax=Anopheles culicifacies TaxID=139723 RepID=A0A182MLT1_9DIPT
MGTVVCLPAGPDLISQCNRCAACLPKAFGKRGVATHCPTVPSSDSVYRLAEVHQSSDGSVTHRLIEGGDKPLFYLLPAGSLVKQVKTPKNESGSVSGPAGRTSNGNRYPVVSAMIENDCPDVTVDNPVS